MDFFIYHLCNSNKKLLLIDGVFDERDYFQISFSLALINDVFDMNKGSEL